MDPVSNQLPRQKSLRLIAWLRHVLAVRKQRKDLARLEDHELGDLGLNKPIALSEAQRKLWDVPHHWRV
jgi:uncharacterized protein YjiS (DUF1127 family)